MKTKILLSIILLLSGTSIAQEVSSRKLIRQFYGVNTGHSYLEFSVLYMGYAKVKELGSQLRLYHAYVLISTIL